MNKYMMTILLGLLNGGIAQATPKLMNTIEGFSTPESVLIHNDTIYVSDMGKDSRDNTISDGGLSRYYLNGKKDSHFKLNAKLYNPMGMTIIKERIYLADGSQVTGISTRNGKLVKRYSLKNEKASFLNDIISLDNRYLIVTATTLKKLFLIDTYTDNVSELKINIQNYAPNGIEYDIKEKCLYLAANKAHTLGEFGNGVVLKYKIDPSKNSTRVINEVFIGRFIDGIKLDKKGSLYISDWNGMGKDGVIYKLNQNTFESISSFDFKIAGLADFDYKMEEDYFVMPELIQGKVKIYKSSF